jgi:putative aldouronate transport system permease protein
MQSNINNLKLQKHTTPKLGKNGFIKNIKKNRTLLLMISPAIVYYVIFMYLPMLGICIAFQNFNYVKGVFGSPLVGFENFRFFFITGDARNVTFNTFAYNAVFVSVNTIFEITIAIFLSELSGKYYKKATQTIMFLPYFISWVVVGAFIYNIFNYEFGSLNTFLKSLNMKPVNVYINESVWKYILLLANMWKWVGYGSVIYLSGIMGIDNEMFEAAFIDGANIFQKIRYITLPSLTPQIVVLTLMNIGQIFRGDFEMFYQVTGNNPMVYKATDVIDTYVFRALINSQEFGMSSAVGLYQSVLCFIIIMVTNYIVKKYHSDYALF